MINTPCSPTASRKRGRPPKAIEQFTWKKGCPSPNPDGRPPKTEFTEAAKEVLERYDPKQRRTGAEQLVDKMFRRAKQGSVKHAALLLNYALGRPVEMNLNLNADVTEEQGHAQAVARIRARQEQADGIVKQFCHTIGVPEPAWGLAGPEMNVEAVQARVNELLAKREKKEAAPKTPMTQGSDVLQ